MLQKAWMEPGEMDSTFSYYLAISSLYSCIHAVVYLTMVTHGPNLYNLPVSIVYILHYG